MMTKRNDVLEAFYRSEYDKLCKKVNRRSGSPENAEDVVQEAFARALKYWPAYDASNKELGAWFNTILNNALKDFKREELTYGMCLELDEEQIDGIEMCQVDENMMAKVNDLIKQGYEGHRELLDLYFNKGYKPREIVEILDMDNKTIRQAIWRFKEEVKEKLIA